MVREVVAASRDSHRRHFDTGPGRESDLAQGPAVLEGGPAVLGGGLSDLGEVWRQCDLGQGPGDHFHLKLRLAE